MNTSCMLSNATGVRAYDPPPTRASYNSRKPWGPRDFHSEAYLVSRNLPNRIARPLNARLIAAAAVPRRASACLEPLPLSSSLWRSENASKCCIAAFESISLSCCSLTLAARGPSAARARREVGPVASGTVNAASGSRRREPNGEAAPVTRPRQGVWPRVVGADNSPASERTAWGVTHRTAVSLFLTRGGDTCWRLFNGRQLPSCPFINTGRVSCSFCSTDGAAAALCLSARSSTRVPAPFMNACFAKSCLNCSAASAVAPCKLPLRSKGGRWLLVEARAAERRLPPSVSGRCIKVARVCGRRSPGVSDCCRCLIAADGCRCPRAADGCRCPRAADGRRCPRAAAIFRQKKNAEVKVR
eukprot:Hpha_TRINITY_DN15303_c0_g2::TRINITY_DN15303_c0_g2_i1::g.88444::m.88444